MKDQIVRMVEGYWGNQIPTLLKAVADATRQVENILVLEDYYRNGRKEESRLQRSFGSFATSTIDVRSLSSVLQQGYDSRAMQMERYRRIQSIAGDLAKLRAGYREHMPGCHFADLKMGPQAILDAFEDHIAGTARASALLRIARLEVGGRYDPATHDGFFEKFNWRQLEDAEMALSPPFVVIVDRAEHTSEFLGSLLELVTGGKPVKVFVLRPTLSPGIPETGRAAALKNATDIELLFLSLRNVYFTQSSLAGPTPLETLVANGLHSPRPAVFSILALNGNTEDAAERAAKALQARAFPHFAYDPDRASDFVSCLDLGENEAREEAWPQASLEYTGENGEVQHLEHPYTFADFAAGEVEFQDQFTPPPATLARERMQPLAQYLAQTPAKRQGKTPFIETVNGKRQLVRRVPSQAMVAQTADRMHLWHTLQELAGIRNPFVQAAEHRLREELTTEREKSLSEQKLQLESQVEARAQQAVADAMKNLALRLTGMSVSGPAPQAAAAVSAPEAPAAEAAPPAAPAPEPAAAPEPVPAAAPVSELPWVEEALCTTCDECTTINKKLFAYNADKKAYILDPKAGPFRDIVRSAEKCASGAIHPGLPLDPGEKDLDKLIKRAERFQ